MAELFSVNYIKLSEFTEEEPTIVLNVDFDTLDKAKLFYDTIAEGNNYGEGYVLELTRSHDTLYDVLEQYEF